RNAQTSSSAGLKAVGISFGATLRRTAARIFGSSVWTFTSYLMISSVWARSMTARFSSRIGMSILMEKRAVIDRAHNNVSVEAEGEQHIAGSCGNSAVAGVRKNHAVGHDQRRSVDAGAVRLDAVYRREFLVGVELPEDLAVRGGIGSQAA